MQGAGCRACKQEAGDPNLNVGTGSGKVIGKVACRARTRQTLPPRHCPRILFVNGDPGYCPQMLSLHMVHGYCALGGILRALHTLSAHCAQSLYPKLGSIA